MAEKLSPGQYLITSLLNNDNLGVSEKAPTIYPPLPAPVIVLPEGALPPRFTVVPVDIGEPNAYVIAVRNGSTRGQEDRVFSFADKPAEVWIIVHREYHNAYTIERKGGPDGWTTPESEEPEQRQIVLRPVTSTKSSPPQFRSSQLFKFERVPEQ
ncbi:hypothetical protein EDD15DRAFT_1668996 [Pisolithus albus]|nr:hypothetical protein EDD15DRAFT_1668996 [Pisolithus albus]